MHEHVFVLQPEALQNFGHVWGSCYWDEDVRFADAVEKLRAVRAAGIETVVDATAYGLGRFVPRVQRINAEVDLNVIVATGVYAFLELPNFLGYCSVDAIAELFVREIREGIDDTGVKAAFIKCAVHDITPSPSPPLVHTNAVARTGLPALEALTSAGVEPGRIVIAHAGDSNNLAYLRAIADTGAWLGCDRFSIEHFNPDAQRIETLVALLAEGYGDRVHLSHDAACFIDFMVGDPAFANERPSYLHISTKILPALRREGITDEQIDEMMIANPRRFLQR